MTLYRVDDAQVRDVDTGRLLDELVGQPVQIVIRDTASPADILDETSSPIPGSLVTVTGVYTVPRFWIDVADASDLYLDWLDPVTGARGPVNFEAVLRDTAQVAAESAASAATAAVGALTAAQELDAYRMELAGAAVAQGAAFWGVWSTGNAPIPPNDGKVHWGLEIV